MRAPHEIARIRHGVGFFKPSPERLARHFAMYDVLHLELENGQKVIVRPLPEERRWRTHAPRHGLLPARPLDASGMIEVKTASEGRETVEASKALWGAWDGRGVIAWRPAR